MKPVVIFGAAPFFQQIKPFIPGLIEKYDTIGINAAQLEYPFRIWAFMDRATIAYIDKVKPFDKAITRSFWQLKIPEKHRHKFEFYTNAGKVIIPPGSTNPGLAFYEYTISFVLNYCYKKGYTDVYLAGIEHAGEYDIYGIREYLCQYKKHLNLWQLDPESTLDIPKKDINECLNGLGIK